MKKTHLEFLLKWKLKTVTSKKEMNELQKKEK
jgi:hypothetical protein